MIRFVFHLSIACLTVLSLTIPCHSQIIQEQTLPPVPGRLLEIVQKENHPMLMANDDLFRSARRRFTQALLEDRADELKQRIIGYFNPESKWYLGEGPLSENKDFHPGQLSPEDFRFYMKVMCEILAFAGIEKERWANNGLKREFQRLLDDIQPESQDPSSTLSGDESGERRIQLLALTSLIYDLVYNRFDTIERHPFNNRLNQIRQQLSSECAATDPNTLPAANRIRRGTALGLSTLLCISIYPNEWEKDSRVSEQSFLPDLYRAITYTYSGLEDLNSHSPHIQMTLPELEALLTTAIPWMECLKRFGYPYQIQQGFYNKIVESFESHRIPGNPEMIHPFLPGILHDPWLPRSQPLFTTIDASMYEKKKDGSQPFVPFNQTRSSGNDNIEIKEGSYKIPDSMQPLDQNIQHDGQTRMSLRESFERFGFPKKPTLIEMPKEERVSNLSAGWVPPALNIPSLWGALYLLAELDDPQSKAGEIWEEQAVDIDSHPYTFLYYTNFPVRNSNTDRDNNLIRYPSIRATLLTDQTPRGEYLLTSQAASETLVLPTYAIDHDSFLFSEGGHQWRWFHEIPSSTHTVSATPAEEIPPIASSVDIQTATPLLTSLFSYWQTYSPVGRTIVVRRHLGGLGSGYTAIAHFPDSATPAKRVQYVSFSVPENGDVIPSEDTPGLYSIHPSADEIPNRPMNMELWRMERRDERVGKKKTGLSSTLNVLFSPDCIKPANAFMGVLGKLLESQVVDPDKPFFYLCNQDMPGREMYEVKYGAVPIEGLRILEWKQGIEIVAIRTGNKIQNSFVESDADFVVIMRDSSMKGEFYLMVNGSYLQYKYSPNQKEFTLLANNVNEKITVAWCQRHLYTTTPPKEKSRFFAPDLLGFECPGFVVQYGQKGKMGVVWESKPAPLKRP